MSEQPMPNSNAARRPDGLRAMADGLIYIAGKTQIETANVWKMADVLREAASALEEAQRERDEARKEAEYWKEAAKVPSGIFRSLERERDQAKRDAEYYRERYEQLKDERETKE